jgi:hypothetical protein
LNIKKIRNLEYVLFAKMKNLYLNVKAAFIEKNVELYNLDVQNNTNKIRDGNELQKLRESRFETFRGETIFLVSISDGFFKFFGEIILRTRKSREIGEIYTKIKNKHKNNELKKI